MPKLEGSWHRSWREAGGGAGCWSSPKHPPPASIPGEEVVRGRIHDGSCHGACLGSAVHAQTLFQGE